MRLLDAAGIGYTVKEYAVDESDLSGVHAAALAGLPVSQVFKPRVLRGASGAYVVCCIGAAGELDLKKAARAAGEKKTDLIPVKELLPLTGYVRGGCSPIGMKKQFPTFIDESALLFDTIAISAGVRGVQLLLKPQDLIRYISAEAAALCFGAGTAGEAGLLRVKFRPGG
jgi:Cys-tRNA(Pro)/Cys-tRNA(Cys) deacylase